MLPVTCSGPETVDDPVEMYPAASEARSEVLSVVNEAAPAVKASGPISIVPKPDVIVPEFKLPTVVSEEPVTPDPNVEPVKTWTPLMVNALPVARFTLPLESARPPDRVEVAPPLMVEVDPFAPTSRTEKERMVPEAEALPELSTLNRPKRLLVEVAI